MIKKLQRKFIAINMSFVALVLLGVLLALCLSNYSRFRMDDRMALNHALDRNGGSLKPDVELAPGRRKRPMNLAPVFVLELDEAGRIADINDSGIKISDESAQEALEAANEKGGGEGLLYHLELRFKKQTMNGAVRIAFVDCGREIHGMQNLLLMSVLIFLGGTMAFFMISLFLARWALAPVERAWRQQRQFVADASHELKTPLTVILANLDILSAHREDAIKDQQRWLDNTKAEAARMKELLNQLLFLARADMAQMPMAFLELDLSNVLWSCILPFESLAYERDADLTEDIEDGISLVGDEGQIRQLAAILLDNACKYVKKHGSIHVSLGKRQEKIVLEVQNSGEVIPPEELEHIFERFYRADKSRTRKEGGYGLGLSIARTIVQNHHGRIRAASGPGEGTVFTVTFP